MRTIILSLIILLIWNHVNAQLANTKWKVTLDIPDPTEVIFDFTTDTVEALSAESNESIETMLYTAKDTVLTLQKITGNSECDETVIGKYKFEIKDDGMYVTLIEDPCDDRSNALNNKQKWAKVE